MTAFQFMATAFYALAGVVCLALAAVIVYAVVVGISRGIKSGGRGNGKRN